MAYTDEIDRWLEKQERPATSFSPRVAAVVSAALVVSLFILFGPWSLTECVPARVKLEGTEFRLLDSAGKPCWAISFPELDPEAYLWAGSNDRDPLTQRSLVADLDEDGQVEVLLIIVENDYAETSTRLVCFEDDASIRWEFRFGRELHWGDRVSTPIYVGMFVQLFRGSDGRLYVLGVARNELVFPVQIVLLDALTGQPVEEWGHPGHIRDVVQFDLDGDGTKEILLGGENNPGDGLGHPSLLVLEPTLAGFGGSLVGSESRAFWDQQAGVYKYYLFALPDVFRATGNGAYVGRIDLVEGNYPRLRVGRGPNDWVYYKSNADDLTFEATMMSGVLLLHNELRREGTLDHRRDEVETRSWGLWFAFDDIPNANSTGIARLFAEKTNAQCQ